MRKSIPLTTVLLSIMYASLLIINAHAGTSAQAIRIGFVVLLSGSAERSFGTPAYNSAKLAVEKINQGLLPAPYNSKGLNGRQIEAIFIDENSKQTVADFKSLVKRHKVDLVIGYISSKNCKEIAPVAEALKQLTILFDCGTPQIFEDIVLNPKYLFRTAGHASMDSIAAARYISDTQKLNPSYGGINQNYSWGHDSWLHFSQSLKTLRPKSKVVDKHFPETYIGEYGKEISELLKHKPQVIHSSFWGGDLEAFLIQAAARDLFSKSTALLTTGESAMHRLADQIPEKTIIGAKGTNGVFAPNNQLNRWFTRNYFNKYGKVPTYPSYKIFQAILAYKAAFNKVKSKTPSKEELAKALRGLKFLSPSGTVEMALSNGHQAIHNIAYGSYKFDTDTGMPKIQNIIEYDARCISPPVGIKSIDWIKSGFKGAQCSSKRNKL